MSGGPDVMTTQGEVEQVTVDGESAMYDTRRDGECGEMKSEEGNNE